MANYKTSWVQRLIDGAWQKTFAFAHAKTVYTDYANKKTLADKLSEIDTEIGNKANKTEIPTELPANGGNSATVNGHTVKSDVPENAVFTDTVYDDTEVQKRISDNGYGEIAGGKNIISPNCYKLVNHWVNSGESEITSNYGQTCAFVPVEAGKTYMYTSSNASIGFGGCCFANANKESINVSACTYANSNSPQIITVPSSASYFVIGSYNSNINYQLEEGSVATEYEPYFPSNNMLAEEKADKTEMTVNLLKPTLETTTLNGVTCTNNGDGTYTLNGTATNANATFDLSFSCSLNSTVKLLGRPKNIDGAMIQTMYNGSWEDPTTWDNTGNGAILSDASKINRLSLFVLKDKSVKNVIFKPMLTTNLNATYDDFVPYTGDSGSLNGDVSEKAPKKNPVFTGSVTVGSRLSDTDFGQNSFTNGDTSQARGNNSFATGDHPVSLGANSQSLGCYTLAKANQCAIGHFNSSSSDDSAMYGTTGTAFYIGNGTEYTRSNAFRVAYDGTPYSKAGLNTTGADYAEFFEWEDGNENNEDRRGYFVTLDGKHIKIANEGDWILGIVSGFPSIIGNGDEEWRGRYVFDEFGCPVIEEFEYEEEVFETITNDEGEEEVITKKVKKTGTKWKEVPEYDPAQPYIERSERKEWSAIGMLGVLSVRDDGSCKVNGFCKLADGGIATASDTGYRVVKRVTDNIVEVIFK